MTSPIAPHAAPSPAQVPFTVAGGVCVVAAGVLRFVASSICPCTFATMDDLHLAGTIAFGLGMLFFATSLLRGTSHAAIRRLGAVSLALAGFTFLAAAALDVVDVASTPSLLGLGALRIVAFTGWIAAVVAYGRASSEEEAAA